VGSSHYAELYTGKINQGDDDNKQRHINKLQIQTGNNLRFGTYMLKILHASSETPSFLCAQVFASKNSFLNMSRFFVTVVVYNGHQRAGAALFVRQAL